MLHYSLLTTHQAAKKLFERFDRESSCDPFSELGATLPAVKGHLQFTGVAFSYPTAEQFKICTGLTLEVQPGQVCALCGPSGSGKSTVIALLQVRLTLTLTLSHNPKPQPSAITLT